MEPDDLTGPGSRLDMPMEHCGWFGARTSPAGLGRSGFRPARWCCTAQGTVEPEGRPGGARDEAGQPAEEMGAARPIAFRMLDLA